MIRKLYPNGKKKAFCLSYDDGTLEDIVFVKLLNSYNIKATFNLNSGLMDKEFEWVNDKNMTIKRLSFLKAKNLYDGHEIASHSYTHPYLDSLNYEQVIYEMLRDKLVLESKFNTKIVGFALPFDNLNEIIKKAARDVGFEYLRSSSTSNSYEPSLDYYNFEAGIFHLDPNFDEYIDGFFASDIELAACQIIGHSYDLKVENKFDKIEQLLIRVNKDDEIINLTTIELVRYLKAMRSVIIQEESIINASNESLWFNIDGKIICVLPKSKYYL